LDNKQVYGRLAKRKMLTLEKSLFFDPTDLKEGEEEEPEASKLDMGYKLQISALSKICSDESMPR